MERFKSSAPAGAVGIGVFYNISDKFFWDIGMTSKFVFDGYESYSFTPSQGGAEKSASTKVEGDTDCAASYNFHTISLAIGFRF